MTNLTTKNICESIDTDNLTWKVDKWFDYKKQDKQDFVDLYNKYKSAGTMADNNPVSAYAETTNIRPFVDFILDNILPSENIDYLYILKKIIELLIANKSYELK